MNQNAKLWVEALRSGEFKQGPLKLNRAGRFCCLGAGCEVAIRLGLDVSRTQSDEIVTYGDECQSAAMPDNVRRFFGLRTPMGEFNGGALYLLNDSSKTFLEIADIIESEPEGLFLPETKG